MKPREELGFLIDEAKFIFQNGNCISWKFEKLFEQQGELYVAISGKIGSRNLTNIEQKKYGIEIFYTDQRLIKKNENFQKKYLLIIEEIEDELCKFLKH